MSINRFVYIVFLQLVTFVSACIEDTEFDYIIVGAGSSGAVIATRLSEIEKYRVLLLEAGDVPLLVSTVPLIAPEALGTEMDWKYFSEPQQNCCQIFKDKKVSLSRGKALGGSSSLNFMHYVRGNKKDYDFWAKENPGWSYKDVLPYFLKSEDYKIIRSRYDKPYHHEGGPLTVSEPSFQTPLATAFLEAGMELGQPLVDYNAEYQTGFMTPPCTLRNGERCSTYNGFLQPAMKRPNLHVITNALVTKIIINEHKIATGVLYEHKQLKCQTKAKREVILSTGALNSPQLLMLSGVGPEETLKKLQIPVIVNLPGVGQNLQDHVTSPIVCSINQTITYKKETYINQKYFDLWTKTRTGPMTRPIASEGVAFFNTKDANHEFGPDIEIAYSSSNQLVAFKRYMRPHIREKLPFDTGDFITFFTILLTPKASGFVTLRDQNPHHPPIVDQKSLSHVDDVKTLVEGIKITKSIFGTEAFKKYGVKQYTVDLPECENFKQSTEDEYLSCFVRSFSTLLHHSCCTCKMGSQVDSMAVVDHKLKVHGVKNLRVADASIMPKILSAHLNAPCIMIGEKVADMIKQDW